MDNGSLRQGTALRLHTFHILHVLVSILLGLQLFLLDVTSMPICPYRPVDFGRLVHLFGRLLDLYLSSKFWKCSPMYTLLPHKQWNFSEIICSLSELIRVEHIGILLVSTVHLVHSFIITFHLCKSLAPTLVIMGQGCSKTLDFVRGYSLVNPSIDGQVLWLLSRAFKPHGIDLTF